MLGTKGRRELGRQDWEGGRDEKSAGEEIGARRGARERGRKRGVAASKLGCQVGLMTTDQRKNVGPYLPEGRRECDGDGGCQGGEPGQEPGRG